MSLNHPFVTIKGRKDGLVLVMDDSCAYNDLLHELKEKLTMNTNMYQKNGPDISVKVQAGNRYLSESQREELKQMIHTFDYLKVEDIHSNVMTVEEFSKKKAQERIVPIARIIRSGQKLSVEGDLLLIGDVNPGGTVIATGNIYILGTLRGVAIAGSLDDGKHAVIVASVMLPTQLKIGQVISRTDDEERREDTINKHIPECAYLDGTIGKIVIDRMQAVLKKHNLPYSLEKM
ncbi:septum site-determining protein MinC [Sporolactobacillus kofuensis]|uniref:Probable septum site-determining protein MinC n=1 Tax=Sporolactobacillus kofuensis TaxID=269672 RepID=A0ABW1W9Q6_9BACL|nr:septum site-determining protein MinC [Sporolactobacillus kofuensis]MCO7175583.1 septum site-determining protein MinC [Sporolactobacillus kofuensis]